MCFAHSVRHCTAIFFLSWCIGLRRDPRDDVAHRGTQGLGWSPDTGNAGTSAERHLCMAGGEGAESMGKCGMKNGEVLYGFVVILVILPSGELT